MKTYYTILRLEIAAANLDEAEQKAEAAAEVINEDDSITGVIAYSEDSVESA